MFLVSHGTVAQQQQIVLALMAHLGDDTHVRHAALCVMTHLAHEHTQDMARFSILVKVKFFIF